MGSSTDEFDDTDDMDELEEGVEGDPLSDPPLSLANLFFFSFRAEVVYWVMSSCAGNLILVSILDAPIECSNRCRSRQVRTFPLI